MFFGPWFGQAVCRYGLGRFSAGGADRNSFVELPRTLLPLYLLVGAVVLFWPGRLWATWSRAGERAVRSAASLMLVLGLVALTWLVLRTARLPGAENFIASLPVRSQVLVGPAGGARPKLGEHSVLPSIVRKGDVEFGAATLRRFALRTTCQQSVCSVSVERAGVAEACGIEPVFQGSLQLREARTVGLWFFDGWSATGEGGPAQLAFRDTDLSCVWPTDLDLAALVKPPSSFLALSLGALLASGLLLWRRDRPAREAAAFSLSLLAFVPILPWLSSLLG